MEFMDTIIPPDSTPDFSDIEYPCAVCGKEAGPYGGRGPKPRYCPDHKKGQKKTGVAASTKSTNLASDATQVLSQLNGIIAIGLMAVGFNDTASAIAGANGLFEQQAMAALTTDPELCRLILKSGTKSAKFSLAFAYAGFGVQVLPTLVNEAREKKAERVAKREAENDEAGTQYSSSA